MAEDAVLETIRDEVIGAVRGFVSRSVSPLLARLEALEKRAPEKGEPGKDGQSVSLADLAGEIAAAAARAVESLPKPQNGKDYDPGALEAAVKRHIEAIPKPKDGEPGKNADPEFIRAEVQRVVDQIPRAKDGEPGKVDMVEIAGLIESATTKAILALPKPKDGEPGKDFDPALLALEVERAVAAIPKPKDGEPGKNADAAAITADVLRQVTTVLDSIPLPKDGKDAVVDPAMVSDAVAAALPPLIEEARAGMAELVARLHGENAMHAVELVDATVKSAFEALPKPKDGEKGKDASPEQIEVAVRRAVEALPKPQDGRSPTAEEVQPIIEAAVQRAMESLPRPKDGEPGKDADLEVMREEIRRAVDALPRPRDGEPGKDADPNVMRVQIVEELSRLPPPLPGKDADPETIRYEISKQLAAIPKGNDGRDGLGIDDLFVEMKDARTVVVGFRNGDRERRHELTFPVVLDEGVYKKGADYQKGAGVTYGGSWWIAQKNTDAVPGTNNDWRLAVKRGRDGKDAS